MRFEPNTCPHCDSPASGIIQDIEWCTAYLDVETDGTYDYAGETDVNWDGQVDHTQDGLVFLYCRTCYDTWTAERVSEPAYNLPA